MAPPRGRRADGHRRQRGEDTDDAGGDSNGSGHGASSAAGLNARPSLATSARVRVILRSAAGEFLRQRCSTAAAPHLSGRGLPSSGDRWRAPAYMVSTSSGQVRAQGGPALAVGPGQLVDDLAERAPAVEGPEHRRHQRADRHLLGALGTGEDGTPLEAPIRRGRRRARSCTPGATEATQSNSAGPSPRTKARRPARSASTSAMASSTPSGRVPWARTIRS